MIVVIVFFLIKGTCSLSGYDCTNHQEKIIYTQGVDNNCSHYGQMDYTESHWEGSVLQVPLTIKTSHKTCNLILRTYTMYCTYSGNPTQLELLNDDVEFVPYQISGTECAKAWDYQLFNYKGTTIPVRAPGITKILVGPEIDEGGFCINRKTTSKVIKGHIELIWSDVTE